MFMARAGEERKENIKGLIDDVLHFVVPLSSLHVRRAQGQIIKSWTQPELLFNINPSRDRLRDDKTLYGDIIWFENRCATADRLVSLLLLSHDNREYTIYVVVLWSFAYDLEKELFFFIFILHSLCCVIFVGGLRHSKSRNAPPSTEAHNKKNERSGMERRNENISTARASKRKKERKMFTNSLCIFNWISKQIEQQLKWKVCFILRIWRYRNLTKYDTKTRMGNNESFTARFAVEEFAT